MTQSHYWANLFDESVYIAYLSRFGVWVCGHVLYRECVFCWSHTCDGESIHGLYSIKCQRYSEATISNVSGGFDAIGMLVWTGYFNTSFCCCFVFVSSHFLCVVVVVDSLEAFYLQCIRIYYCKRSRSLSHFLYFSHICIM